MTFSLVVAMENHPGYLSNLIIESIDRQDHSRVIHLLVRYRGNRNVLKEANADMVQRTGHSIIQRIKKEFDGPYQACLLKLYNTSYY